MTSLKNGTKKLTHPKNSPSGSVHKGVPLASAVSNGTLISSRIESVHQCGPLRKRNVRKRKNKHSHVTPPSLNRVDTNVTIPRVLQTEEYQNCSNGNTRVQSRGQDVIILGPPREVAAADDILEDEPDDTPRNIVDGTGRRDVTRSREDDGEAGRRLS